MKKTILSILPVLFCFAVKSQTVTVGADKAFTASLNDYSTYTWSKNIDQIPSDGIYVNPTGVYVFNNESARSKIKNAIEYELSAKGYEKNENTPDMLVLFTVTERPGTLKTYNGYQMIDNGLDSVRTPDNVQRTKIDAGTLIINIIDAKTDAV